MPITFAKTTASFNGSCSAEETADLAAWLAGRKRPRVNLKACSHLHTALLQVLMAGKVTVTKQPSDPFLARWLPSCLVPERNSEPAGEKTPNRA